jgi:hypothetical protein
MEADMRKCCVALFVFASIAAAVGAQTLDRAELSGRGSWKTDHDQKRPAQRWSLDLQRGEDGAMSGEITIGDSPLFRTGRVAATVDGDSIHGRITDEQGEHVANFDGVVSAGRLHGNYTDRTGETGEWEWEGKLPE